MKTPKILLTLIAMFAVSLIGAALDMALLPAGATLVTAMAFVAGSTKSAKELRELKAETVEKAKGIVDKAKSEKRNMNADELAKYNEFIADMNLIEDEIRSAEEFEKRVAEMAGTARSKQVNKDEDKLKKSFSLKRAIEAKLDGRALDGAEAEAHQEAQREARESGISISGIGLPSMFFGEKRAMTATGTTSVAGDQGGMAIMTEKQGLLQALRPQLVLAQLGAQTLGNLVGNIDLVKGTAISATWEGENDDAAESNITTSKISLSPKRLAAYSTISKQLLAQSEINFNTVVMDELMRAIAQAVESAAISGASGGSNPVGILNTSGIGTVAGGTDGLAPAWSHITELEKEVAIDNALMGSLAYLTNPKVKAKLKNTKLDTGSGLFVWGQNSNELNGYNAAVSTLVPSNLTKGTGTALSAILFGDFSTLTLAQWAGVDIVVDQYTKAKNAQIVITANSWWDVAVRYPEKFAAMVDAITA